MKNNSKKIAFQVTGYRNAIMCQFYQFCESQLSSGDENYAHNFEAIEISVDTCARVTRKLLTLPKGEKMGSVNYCGLKC